MMKRDELVSALISVLGDAGVMTGDRVHERSAGIWGPPRTVAADVLVIPKDAAAEHGLMFPLDIGTEGTLGVVTRNSLPDCVDYGLQRQ